MHVELEMLKGTEKCVTNTCEPTVFGKWLSGYTSYVRVSLSRDTVLLTFTMTIITYEVYFFKISDRSS